jgi:hypothetical protein
MKWNNFEIVNYLILLLALHLNHEIKNLDFVESGYPYYSCKVPSLEIDEHEINMISGRLTFTP